jgi:hypothetical protein
MDAPAKLSGALLARKGLAAPSGFAPPRLIEQVGGNVVSVARAPAPRPAADTSGTDEGKRLRVSMRVDPELHLRLRLTAAYLQRSVQCLMKEALDRHLDQLAPEVIQDPCVCQAMRCGRASD